MRNRGCAVPGRYACGTHPCSSRKNGVCQFRLEVVLIGTRNDVFALAMRVSRLCASPSRGRIGLDDSGLPLRAVEKCSLRGGLPIPTAPAVRPDDSRHRFGGGARPHASRRISGAVARGATAAFFGTVNHGAQGRLDPPRPPRPRTERHHVPRPDRCGTGGESRGRRGSSDPADLERPCRMPQKSRSVPSGGGADSPPTVERSGGPTDAGCRADRPSRRQQTSAHPAEGRFAASRSGRQEPMRRRPRTPSVTPDKATPPSRLRTPESVVGL